MLCPQCKSEIGEGKFCQFCGAKNPSASPSPGPQSPPPAYSPPAYAPPPAAVGNPNQLRITELEKKIENYMLYGIISIFLFWPLAIYFFVVRSNDQQELTRLQSGNPGYGGAPQAPPPSYT